jgi:hypothetical protein
MVARKGGSSPGNSGYLAARLQLHRRFLLSSFHALPPSLVDVGVAAIDTVSVFSRHFSSA